MAAQELEEKEDYQVEGISSLLLPYATICSVMHARHVDLNNYCFLAPLNVYQLPQLRAPRVDFTDSFE